MAVNEGASDRGGDQVGSFSLYLTKLCNDGCFILLCLRWVLSRVVNPGMVHDDPYLPVFTLLCSCLPYCATTSVGLCDDRIQKKR